MRKLPLTDAKVRSPGEVIETTHPAFSPRLSTIHCQTPPRYESGAGNQRKDVKGHLMVLKLSGHRRLEELG